MTEVDPDEVPVAVDLSCDSSIQAPWCIDLHNNATTKIFFFFFLQQQLKMHSDSWEAREHLVDFIYHIENR